MISSNDVGSYVICQLGIDCKSNSSVSDSDLTQTVYAIPLTIK